MIARILRLAALVLLVAFAETSASAAPQTLDEARAAFDDANAHYKEDRFAEALEGYLALEAAGFGTAEVLANAGNAYWRTGDTGHAVLQYVRALRVDPACELARENLRRVQPETNTVADDSFGTLLLAWFGSTPTMVWYALLEVAFALLVAAIALAGRAAPRTEARSGWLGRCALASVAVVVLAVLALVHHDARTVDGDGVLVQKTVSRSGPGEKYFEQLELPAGTLMEFKTAPRDGWVEFRLADGTTGFVPSGSVEAI